MPKPTVVKAVIYYEENGCVKHCLECAFDEPLVPASNQVVVKKVSDELTILEIATVKPPPAVPADKASAPGPTLNSPAS